MSRRSYIPWPEKCAALICLHFGIPYAHARAMHVDQVNALVHYDHYPVAKALGGPDKFFNLTPRLISDHRLKTAKIDQPAQAKIRRVTAANEAFRRTMLAKAGQPVEGPGHPTRPKRKLKGRGFVGYRKFDGTPVWRQR